MEIKGEIGALWLSQPSTDPVRRQQTVALLREVTDHPATSRRVRRQALLLLEGRLAAYA